jgi:hypothetical protein
LKKLISVSTQQIFKHDNSKENKIIQILCIFT